MKRLGMAKAAAFSPDVRVLRALANRFSGKVVDMDRVGDIASSAQIYLEADELRHVEWVLRRYFEGPE